MRLQNRSVLLASAYFILQTNALPRPHTTSYSVVNVNGPPSDIPTIIYSTITSDTETTVSVTLQNPASTVTMYTEGPDTQPTGTPYIPVVSGTTVTTVVTSVPTTTQTSIPTSIPSPPPAQSISAPPPMPPSPVSPASESPTTSSSTTTVTEFTTATLTTPCETPSSTSYPAYGDNWSSSYPASSYPPPSYPASSYPAPSSYPSVQPYWNSTSSAAPYGVASTSYRVWTATASARRW